MTVDKVPNADNPLGWSPECHAADYNDGICHCECGIWDPDCDQDSVDVLALNNGAEPRTLSLLDSQQGNAVMKRLDDNGNGVLDHMEIPKIYSIGRRAMDHAHFPFLIAS